MKSVKLKCVEDRATGELGLIVEGTRLMDYPMVSSEGLLIAHDLLEHQQGVKKIGSIDDELIALGGVWFVRGLTGVLRRDRSGSIYSTEENLGGDIASMARIYRDGVNFRSAVPCTRRSEEDNAFESMLTAARKMYRAEAEYDEPEGAEDHRRLETYFEAALHYLRKGYRLAQRRFGTTWRANAQFWAIAEAVDPHARHLEYAGQEFVLSYGKERAQCRALEPVW